MIANIKMRKEFISESSRTFNGCEFIVVSNFDGINQILNSPLDRKFDKEDSEIGVWKIKQLKQ